MPDGIYTAGDDEGEFTVTARSGDVSSTVRVLVASQAVAEPTPGFHQYQMAGHGSLRWSGEVPPQKWMHFYSKVLAKFVNSGGLSVRVSVEVSPDGGVTPEQMEEMKAALREMGLDAKIESG